LVAAITPHIDLQVGGAANAREGLLFQKPQQLCLERGHHLAQPMVRRLPAV